jgi:hypothetical protein
MFGFGPGSSALQIVTNNVKWKISADTLAFSVFSNHGVIHATVHPSPPQAVNEVAVWPVQLAQQRRASVSSYNVHYTVYAKQAAESPRKGSSTWRAINVVS